MWMVSSEVASRMGWALPPRAHITVGSAPLCYYLGTSFLLTMRVRSAFALTSCDCPLGRPRTRAVTGPVPLQPTATEARAKRHRSGPVDVVDARPTRTRRPRTCRARRWRARRRRTRRRHVSHDHLPQLTATTPTAITTATTPAMSQPGHCLPTTPPGRAAGRPTPDEVGQRHDSHTPRSGGSGSGCGPLCDAWAAVRHTRTASAALHFQDAPKRIQRSAVLRAVGGLQQVPLHPRVQQLAGHADLAGGDRGGKEILIHGTSRFRAA